MRKERTLAIIKPDAVLDKHIGDIIKRYEGMGLRISALKMLRFTKDMAEKFYSEHRNKSFFKELLSFMVSAPLVILVLEGDNAISRNRALMGNTDPKSAPSGTLRSLYGASVTTNAVHGSDSNISAEREIKFFFREEDLC